VKALGERAVTVLGNHDLHLLCVAEGVQRVRRRDTFEAVLAAPDRDELLDWLRHRPMFHAESPIAMVHAGLLPSWSVARARELASEVETALRAPTYRAFLEQLYGDKPARWSESLEGMERLRVIVNAMTRLRLLERDGTMVLGFKGEPGEAWGSCAPWFDHPERQSRDHAIVCGHWSALGRRVRPDLLAIDSGCVWGRELTAVRLRDRAVYAAPCPGSAGQEG
jgi:bis(5'-nucleosyl)-tetraphosphatase (symmetrical)